MSKGTHTMEENSNVYKKIVILARVLESIVLVSNRFLFIFLSVVILVVSYFTAPFLVGAVLITKAGTIITVLGLVLSIKHSFIYPNSTALKALLLTEDYMLLPWEGTTYCLDNMEKTYERLSDEVSGFSLIIIGTLFASYGDLLPLVKLSWV